MALLEYAKIIGRAAWVRHEAGLDDAEPPYSIRLIMDRVFPRIVVTGADLPRGVSELAVADESRRALFYNRHIHHPAQRVGLAHGLYHHLTDIKGEYGMRECNVAVRQIAVRAVELRDPVEIACDLFAAELLTPLDVLDRFAPDPLWGDGAISRDALEDEFDSLASKFNVPKGFVRWRCFDLQAFRRSHYNPAR